MIKKNTYLNAVPTATELADKKIFLSASPSSVLGELLNLSASYVMPANTELPRILANPGAGQSTTLLLDEEFRATDVECNTGDYETQSLHSLKMMALADDIAPLVQAHISHARNVVKPLVMELTAKLEHFVQVAKPNDPSALFEIEKRGLPELVLDESFMSDGISSYDGMDFEFEGISFSLEVPSGEEFYSSLTRLANDRLDALVNKWLRSLPADFIRGVYLYNFTNTAEATATTLKPEKYYRFNSYGVSRNPYDRLNLALAGYLLGTRFLLEVQPTQSVTLVAYKTAMRNVVDYSACEIIKAARTIQRQIDSGILVSEASPFDKRIVVNASIYEKWIEAGGCPEALLGMLVSGQVSYDVSAVNEMKDSLVRQWQAYVMFSQSTVKNELFTRFKDYAVSEVIAGLSDLTPGELEYSSGRVDFRNKIAREALAQVDHLSHRLMDDLEHTALHLVAKGRFYYTSAYQILNEMKEVAKQNPDIDPREAALLSAVTYVADYFETQTIVTG